MAQKSTIKTLPADVRERLNFLIAEDQLTIDDLTNWLDSQGYARSRSAIHRHAARVKKMTMHLQQSREITQALVSNLGDSAAQGEQGRVLVEIARSLVFDFMAKLQDENGEDGEGQTLDTKDIANLGKGLAEMGRAMRLDQDFEAKVRELASKQARAEAADSAEGALKEAGLSPEQLQFWKQEFLGVRPSDKK